MNLYVKNIPENQKGMIKMQYEAIEQIKVVQYCNLKKIRMFHTPNGGSRNRIEAINLKRQGVSSGVPDLCFPIPNRKYHGLFIEMKYGKNKPTENQKKWIDYLNSVGYLACVCYGANEAIKLINEYVEECNL